MLVEELEVQGSAYYQLDHCSRFASFPLSLPLADVSNRGLKTDDVMKVFGTNSVHVNVLWVDEKEAFAVVDRSLQFDASTSPKQVFLVTAARQTSPPF
jgi:hypothetical protein